MRYTWKGNWRQGEVTIEAENLEELNKALDKLMESVKHLPTVTETGTGIDSAQVAENIKIPSLPAGLGATNAIRALLQSDWGRQPRTMKEIEEALEANALYFSKGTLSGTLNMMTKAASVRRFKRGGVWAYVAR
jgi:hypothetical protein